MLNVISIADMADDHVISMNTKYDKAMYVHLPDKIVRFRQINNRLYGLDPKEKEQNILT